MEPHTYRTRDLPLCIYGYMESFIAAYLPVQNAITIRTLVIMDGPACELKLLD